MSGLVVIVNFPWYGVFDTSTRITPDQPSI
jgi:hypothetical protein